MQMKLCIAKICVTIDATESRSVQFMVFSVVWVGYIWAQNVYGLGHLP